MGDGNWYIYPIGDTHLGTKHCTESDLIKKVQEIKDTPTALWIGMGDYGEFISPRDKRWDGKVVADWLAEDRDNIAEGQTEYIYKLFKGIASKCIGLIEGNHEDAMRKFGNVDVQKNLCKRLEVPNLGYSAWVRLRFTRENSAERHVFPCVFTHGAGWAITPGAKMNRLQRLMSSFSARVYGIGHMHDVITSTIPYLELTDANLIKQKERVGAITGSWVRAYSQGIAASYAEIKGYPPTSLGCPRFVVNPSSGGVRVEG